jgi:hypothetical protein
VGKVAGNRLSVRVKNVRCLIRSKVGAAYCLYGFDKGSLVVERSGELHPPYQVVSGALCCANDGQFPGVGRGVRVTDCRHYDLVDVGGELGTHGFFVHAFNRPCQRFQL